MYIYHTAGFVDQALPEREPLKPRLRAVGAGALRRAGRFNQLAVLGAASCAGGLTLPTACDVMVASVASNVSDTAAVLGDAIQRHQSPMPFSFMNTQGNSACYNVANVLGLNGNSLFISHPSAPFESALMLARVRSQFSSAQLLMLGIVDEWTLPCYCPPTGYCKDEQAIAYEGSCWFVVGNSWLGCSPAAHILEVEQTLTLTQVKERLTCVDLSSTVHWDLCSQARSLVPLAMNVKTSDSAGYTALHENFAINSWLKQGRANYYGRIRKNRLGGFRMLLIERLGFNHLNQSVKKSLFPVSTVSQ